MATRCCRTNIRNHLGYPGGRSRESKTGNLQEIVVRTLRDRSRAPNLTIWAQIDGIPAPRGRRSAPQRSTQPKSSSFMHAISRHFGQLAPASMAAPTDWALPLFINGSLCPMRGARSQYTPHCLFSDFSPVAEWSNF